MKPSFEDVMRRISSRFQGIGCRQDRRVKKIMFVRRLHCWMALGLNACKALADSEDKQWRRSNDETNAWIEYDVIDVIARCVVVVSNIRDC